MFLIGGSLKSHAQQLPIFTQYSEYGGLINASYIAFSNYHLEQRRSVGISYRDQWVQLPSRPRTLAVRYDAGDLDGRGMNLIYGGYLLHDEIGVFTTTELKGRIAGFFKLSDRRNKISGFAAGINFGIGQYRTNLSEFAYIDLDPILFRGNATVLYPDVGAGLSYLNEFQNDDYLQIGISIPQIFSLNHTYKQNREQFDVQRVPHFYLTAAYYKILTDNTYLEFSGWAKRVKNIPMNYDFVLRYRFAHNMWLGAGANTSGIIHTEAGFIFKVQDYNEVKVGYSFNPTFYSHSVIFGNIHELNISYAFD